MAKNKGNLTLTSKEPSAVMAKIWSMSYHKEGGEEREGVSDPAALAIEGKIFPTVNNSTVANLH